MGISVIALGGNAILDKDPTDVGQKEVVKTAARHIVDFILQQEEVIVSHGNGPQVGNLLIQQKASNSPSLPSFALDSCVAMTQGSIGYWLQTALISEFNKKDLDKMAVSVVNQVLVDPDDKSFENPTKPIGPFITKEEMLKEQELNNTVFIEDAGRGYRKVVPSPKPIKVIEHEAIKALLVKGIVPICVGGGGVPVVEDGSSYKGVEAVIDKDFSSAVLAENVGADRLIILTGVDKIYLYYNTEKQQELNKITIQEAEKYVVEGHFGTGSMLPKVEAAIKFVKGNPQRQAVITSIENLGKINEGVGTIIVDG